MLSLFNGGRKMSCSNNSNKSCRDKSCERYYNNNNQVLNAGTTIQLVIAGSKVVDSGIAIDVQPQSYTILKTGLYHISADVVVDANVAGNVVFQVYMDGVALPCTTKTVTLAEGETAIHTETDLRLSACCCDVSHNFTFTLSSPAAAAGNVIEFCSGILKLA